MILNGRRRTTSREGENLKRSEVGLLEDVDLKVLAPRQTLDKLRRVRHERVVLCAQLLVDDGSES